MDNYQIKLGNIHNLPLRLNEGISFILVMRGSVHLEVNKNEYSLSENDIVALGTGDIYSLYSKNSNVVLFIHLPESYLMERHANLMTYQFTCNSSLPNENGLLYVSLRKHIAQMAFLHFKNELGYDLLFQSELFQALHILVKDFSASMPLSPEQEEPSRLRLAMSYITLNYKNRISLTDVARVECVTTQYLSRLFRARLGTTFTEYINSLRLDAADQELLSTSKTITKIALDNGFSGERAFGKQFIGRHGCSPTEYRKKHQTVAAEPGLKGVLFHEVDHESLEALVRFINNHPQEGTAAYQIQYSLDLEGVQTKPLVRPHVMVDIGDMSMALRADTRMQIGVIQKYHSFSYVYFSGFIKSDYALVNDEVNIKLYDLFEIFNYFYQAKLIPFIQLECGSIDEAHNLELFLKNLGSLLEMLIARLPKAYCSQWHFELCGNSQLIQKFLDPVRNAIRGVSADFEVGIRLEGSASQWPKLLSCTDTIDFLSFSIDPNTDSAPSDPSSYETFHSNYHMDRTCFVQQLAHDAGLGNVPLFIVDWNTLTGKTTAEAGEFHRTALLFDVLFKLSGKVEGIAIRLSLYNKDHSLYAIPTYPLSLFVYRGIRRPMYFVIKTQAELKPCVVDQREYCLLTTDDKKQYALMLYNPCYIDPFQSLDNIHCQSYAKVISYQLSGLRPGRYRVKKFLMDKDNGSIYLSWLKIDFSIPLDEEDIDEYLENVSNPSATLYETRSNGSLDLYQELAMNAICLYIIKKID